MPEEPEESIFAKIKYHGNTKWLQKNWGCLAALRAFSESRHLTDAYAEAQEKKQLRKIQTKVAA